MQISYRKSKKIDCNKIYVATTGYGRCNTSNKRDRNFEEIDSEQLTVSIK